LVIAQIAAYYRKLSITRHFCPEQKKRDLPGLLKEHALPVINGIEPPIFSAAFQRRWGDCQSTKYVFRF